MSGRTRLIALGLFAALAGAGAAPATAAGTPGTSTISGTAWSDTNRDAAFDASETPRQGDLVYLEDASGTLLKAMNTDASGAYAFNGLANGDYRVEYDGGTWSTLQSDWTPTTTGSLYPNISIHLQGAARADFGWRQIVRSSTPLSSYVSAEGVTVESYDDVLTARMIYDALHAGTMIGAEAPRTRVQFDSGPTSVTSVSVNGSPGSFYGYRATSLISWDAWLAGGDTTLFHEYGHAASLYAAYMVQQDGTLTAYLKARGLLNDPRLDSSHAWNRSELLAEDFRQRFGSTHAAAAPQENTDVPRMSSVPGLADYLAGTFRGTPPAPTPSPSPSASPTASPSASPSASPTASPSAKGKPSKR
jgi:hypothetical protein